MGQFIGVAKPLLSVVKRQKNELVVRGLSRFKNPGNNRASLTQTRQIDRVAYGPISLTCDFSADENFVGLREAAVDPPGGFERQHICVDSQINQVGRVGLMPR